MKYLISAFNYRFAEEEARRLCIPPKKFVHIPFNAYGRPLKLQGRRVSDTRYLVGYFTEEEINYLTEGKPESTCPYCGESKRVYKRRQNTAYADDKQNVIEACDDCFAEIQEYWQERWDEYNSGRL